MSGGEGVEGLAAEVGCGVVGLVTVLTVGRSEFGVCSGDERRNRLWEGVVGVGWVVQVLVAGA